MENKKKIRKDNYEILCIIRESDGNKKQNLISEIENVIRPDNISFNSETKTLAYPIEDIEKAEYLLIKFNTERKNIIKIEELLKESFIIRFIIVNLDTEKKIKIKKSQRIQKNIKPARKVNFEKNKTENKFKTVGEHSSSFDTNIKNRSETK